MNTATNTFSRAETRVLGELLRGGQVKEIANRLYISYHTANRHIANMSMKIGAHSLQELVTYAWAKASGLTIEEVLKKVGTLCLLAIFTAYTFGSDDDVLRARRSRRNRRENEIEIIG